MTPTDITIKDRNHFTKIKLGIPDDAVHKRELMKENRILLSFNLNEYIKIERGDYIEWDNVKYSIRTDQKPEEAGADEFKYSLKFEAIEMRFQDFILFYTQQELRDSVWKLTSNAASFVQVAVENIKRELKDNEWKVGVIEPTEIKPISFDATTIFDALTSIAQTFDAEWYVADKTINLVKKHQYGSEVLLEREIALAEMNRSEGNTGDQCTRLFPFGSTRNIPADYRDADKHQQVDGITQHRLRLPKSVGEYIDAWEDMADEEVVIGIKNFEEVYPKRIGTITSVRSEEVKDVGLVFYIKDDELQFKDEYIIKGETLKLSFESGHLNGRDFELGYDDKTKEFEIINQQQGVTIPNTSLAPKAGDKYILYNFDTKMVSDIYIPAAEIELHTEAKKWLNYQQRDTSVFTCPTVASYCHTNELDLEIGQKVSLKSVLFAEGYRNSRIMGYEKKLLNKYECTYTIGDNSKYSRLSNIEKSISELEYANIFYQNTGGSGVYLIKQFDDTAPTDFNAYSSKAANTHFLKRDQEDSALRKITFNQGIDVKEGVVSDIFESEEFTSGQFGSGFKTWMQDGISYSEIDNLMVRREAVFNKLTVAEIKSVGGQILVSMASMNCSAVIDADTYYQCFFDTDGGKIDNLFKVNDLVICRRFNGQGMKYYWRRVSGIGVGYINLLKADCDGVGTPEVGDDIIQFGHKTEKERQSAIMISAYGTDAPSLKQYGGIDSYNLTDKEITVISPSGNKFTGSFNIVTGNKTQSIQDYTDGKVETINTELKAELKVQADKIASKVNQTDFSALTGRVSSAESSITQTAGKIESTVERVDNLQAEIDSKNRTFYGDTKPATPEGGFKVGDVWYMPEKNGYYESFYWNGTIWEPFNVSVGKSKMEQTDQLIASTVEKTSGLQAEMSKISQTASEIKLEVSNIQVGGRNYLSKTGAPITIIGQDKVNQCVTNLYYLVKGTIGDNNLTDRTVTLSFDWEVVGTPGGIYTLQYGFITNGLDNGWTEINANKGRHEKSAIMSASKINAKSFDIRIDNLPTTAKFIISNAKLEIGNKATDWSLAPEDVQANIDYIQAKERNLIPSTNTGTAGWHYTVGGGIHKWEEEILRSGVRAAKSTTTVISPTYHVLCHSIDHSLIKNNTEYTLSCDVKCDFDATLTPYLRNDNGLNTLAYWGGIPIKKDNWTKVQVTSRTNNEKKEKQVLYLTGFNAIGSVTIANLQLVEGNKVFNWSPAPEDIANKEDIKTSLTLNDNGISLFGKTIHLDGTTIAKAIQAGNLDVGNGNFTVDGNGQITAKGATIEGTIQTGETGDRIVLSKENNSILILNKDNSAKILIKPTNITTLSNLPGTDIKKEWGKENKDYLHNDISGEDVTKSYSSNTLTLPKGKIYDIYIPTIDLEVSSGNFVNAPGYFFAGATVYLIDKDTDTYHHLKSIGVNEGSSRAKVGGGIMLSAVNGGTYYIRVQFELYNHPGPTNNTTYRVSASFSVGEKAQIIGYPLLQRTEIGNDGIMSVWSLSKYFHMTSDKLEVRFGNYGLRVSESGLQKTKNGQNWSDL